MANATEQAVAAHYGKAGLADAILAGLAAAGADLDALTIEDLAPVDEFHTAGHVMTVKALAMTPLSPGMHVLDAGCGLGGTVRRLAVTHGCRATGVDLTPDYVEIARMLTARMGLSEQCAFEVGSATEMPFADAAFDAAVTLHAAMNIERRDLLYGELARVLKPAASLCIFDAMKGPAPGMPYPVPWAETEATSFLKTPEETKSLLTDAGFTISAEESQRDFAIKFFHDSFANSAKAGGPPPLGFHLLTGANAKEKFSNYTKALEGDQVAPVIIIATRT